MNENQTPDKVVEKLSDVAPYVKTCRDFYEGAVKVLNRQYLPMMDRETPAGHKIRLKTTTFANLYSPVITGITGLLTKKEPVTDGFEKFPLDNIDGKQTNLPTFIKNIITSSLVGGVEFISVETSDDIADPFFKRYRYEQLISYQVDSLEKITQIVFKEELEEPDGLFNIKTVTRYVVFRIGGGEVWYDSGQGLAKQDEWTNTLTEIPVVGVITGKERTKFEIIPKFYDLAKLNEVMLNVDTQLANILSVVGNPIPIFYGQLTDKTLTIGVKDVLVFKDKQKEGVEFAEVKGEGITKLQEKLKEIESAIDKTSFSVLNKDDNNTVIDAQDNQNKSASFLSDIAEELDSKINRLFRFYSEISGIPLPENEVIVFKKDFDDILFNSKQLELMLKMLEGGNLSRETLWQKLKVSGTLPKDFDEQEELARLDTMVV